MPGTTSSINIAKTAQRVGILVGSALVGVTIQIGLDNRKDAQTTALPQKTPIRKQLRNAGKAAFASKEAWRKKGRELKEMFVPTNKDPKNFLKRSWKTMKENSGLDSMLALGIIFAAKTNLFSALNNLRGSKIPQKAPNSASGSRSTAPRASTSAARGNYSTQTSTQTSVYAEVGTANRAHGSTATTSFASQSAAMNDSERSQYRPPTNAAPTFSTRFQTSTPVGGGIANRAHENTETLPFSSTPSARRNPAPMAPCQPREIDDSFARIGNGPLAFCRQTHHNKDLESRPAFEQGQQGAMKYYLCKACRTYNNGDCCGFLPYASTTSTARSSTATASGSATQARPPVHWEPIERDDSFREVKQGSLWHACRICRPPNLATTPSFSIGTIMYTFCRNCGTYNDGDQCGFLSKP